MKKTKNKIFINGRFLTQKCTGIQRFSMEMSNAMNKKEDIIVLAPRKIRKEYNPKFTIVKFGVSKGLLWEHIELPLFLLFKRNPLLINFGSTGPVFYRNRIITIHDISFYIHPEWFSRVYAFYYKAVTPVIARLSKKVLTVSKFSKQEILKWLNIPENKIIVIHNSVSEKLKEYKEKKTEEQDYILTVSSLDPRKNLKRLLTAYNKSNYSEKLKLKIAGTSSSLFKMQKDQAINAVSMGYVSDKELAKLYKNANLFVYISLYEGFGIPPLEAMYFGCPVILSDIPVFREIFGDAAYYVNPFSEQEISEAINKIISDSELRTSLINKGYQIIQNYSWEKSATILCNIIN